MNIEISIIIPVYNTGSYLSQCVESVMAQTLASREVILIEDCSTDDSYTQVEELKTRYSELIIVKNSENKGLSYCRNVGIQKAKGRYVAFIDSDDYIQPEMFERLTVLAKRDDLDIVMSNYRYIFSDNTSFDFKRDEKIYNLGPLPGIDFLKESIKFKSLPAGGNCSNIYKTEFLRQNSLFYELGTYFEDIPFQLDTLLQAHKVKCISESFYFYMKREHSITSSFTPKKVKDYFTISCDLYEKYQKYYFLKPVFYELFYSSTFQPEGKDNINLAADLFKKLRILKKMFAVSTKFRHILICFFLWAIGPLKFGKLRTFWANRRDRQNEAAKII